MVGNRIREIRVSQGLTMSRLAAETGLSPALISQVERDITDPSLETLRKLARALDVPLFSLFQGDAAASASVVRSDRRMRVTSPHGDITYARVSPGSGRLEVLEGTLEPGGASSEEPWSHPSEECVVVLTGRVVVEVADERLAESKVFEGSFGGRVLPGSDDPAKYKNSPETEIYTKSQTLYRLN